MNNIVHNVSSKFQRNCKKVDPRYKYFKLYLHLFLFEVISRYILIARISK